MIEHLKAFEGLVNQRISLEVAFATLDVDCLPSKQVGDPCGELRSLYTTWETIDLRCPKVKFSKRRSSRKGQRDYP